MNIGMTILIILVIFSIAGITILLFKNFSMNEKLKKLKNTNKKVDSLGILQDFMLIIGDNLISSKQKMNKINNMLIEKYNIKYSTIVIFNGLEDFKIQASNVSEKHWNMFENLHSQDIFMESINNATPKYITVNKGEKLPYLDMEFERAKSAIFFPMYIDNIYIGYWMIEGNKSHEFDNIDTTILEVIKNNLISAIRCIKNQKTLENLARIDDITGLSTYEYLYANAIKVIDKYPMSIVSLIKIINLQQIEEKISKKTSDAVMIKVSDFIRSSLSPEYFCVKYSENILAIVFSGSDMEGVEKFLEDIKNNVEKLTIKTFASLDATRNGRAVAPKLNIVMSTYYKETALEEVINNLNKYLNESAPNESSLTIL